MMLMRPRSGAGGNDEAGGYRYWRLYVSANNGATNVTVVNEIEMRSIPGGADQTQPDGVAVASSYGDASTVPKSAFDNNLTTYWRTATGQYIPCWIGYDFGAGNDISIQEITIAGHGSYGRDPKDFEIQFSTDGVGWTNSWSVVGQINWAAGEIRTFTKP